jgi:GrpB-like predicted nucleotidyltransferase (UPF0157 family)
MIIDYNTETQRLESIESRKIIEAVGKEFISRIEHIGSTAVPGLCAKPTINFILEILDMTNCGLIIKHLQIIDYHYIPHPENPAPHLMFAKGYSKPGIK